jgi:hypothetical protein
MRSQSRYATRRISSVVFLCVSAFSICSFLVRGCSLRTPDSSFTQANLKKISTESRSEDSFDLTALKTSTSQWMSSKDSRTKFFLNPALGNAVSPANWKDVELVQDALLSRSLLAANKGDEKTSRESLILFYHISLSILRMSIPDNMSDYDGISVTKQSISTTIVLFSRFQLTSTKQYLDKYPSNARNWKWYQTTYDLVAKSRSETTDLNKRLLSLSSSLSAPNSPEWVTLLKDAQNQMIPRLEKISAAING